MQAVLVSRFCWEVEEHGTLALSGGVLDLLTLLKGGWVWLRGCHHMMLYKIPVIFQLYPLISQSYSALLQLLEPYGRESLDGLPLYSSASSIRDAGA